MINGYCSWNDYIGFISLLICINWWVYVEMKLLMFEFSIKLELKCCLLIKGYGVLD